jgi:alcohol dehydrogenase class IV
MESFTYEGLPSRVVFGAGTRAHLADELTRLERKRALVLSTKAQAGAARELASQLGTSLCAVFTEATMHTPVAVTEKAMNIVRELKIDCVVAIGGGSTIGLSKAIALRTDLDQIVLPTTYAGSEATPIIGETVEGTKVTQRTTKVLPETIIYDVELTLGLPVDLTVTSGVNSVAHAVEALWARQCNPVTSLLAREAIGALVGCLPSIVQNPRDIESRSRAQYGAWLAAKCLASVDMGLHHKLAHVLGGTFNLPHAETHTVLLPYVIAYNAAAAPEAMSVIEDVVGAPGAGALRKLLESLSAPTSLSALGMPESGIPTAVDRCLAGTYGNPRPLDRDSLLRLVGDAWNGSGPSADGYPAGSRPDTRAGGDVL